MDRAPNNHPVVEMNLQLILRQNERMEIPKHNTEKIVVTPITPFGHAETLVKNVSSNGATLYYIYVENNLRSH